MTSKPELSVSGAGALPVVVDGLAVDDVVLIDEAVVVDVTSLVTSTVVDCVVDEGDEVETSSVDNAASRFTTECSVRSSFKLSSDERRV